MKSVVSNRLYALDACKHLTPCNSRLFTDAQETRIELPFYLIFENLTYIGVVMRETWNVSSHYHEHFELCYVDEGDGWFAIDDMMYQVHQGDLFLTKPGEVHQGAAAGDAPFRLYYLGFQLNQLTALEMDYYQLGIKRVVRDAEATVRGLFTAMFDELQGRQRHCLEMVQGLFLRLLVQTLRTYECVASASQDMPLVLSPLLRTVLQMLHSQVGRYHNIDDLATSVHLSRSYLTREFKRAMGVSLGHYMRLRCLEAAKYYLCETCDSVSTIADRLHFPSIHTFSIFFKRHTGLSPQEYRKQVAKQVS